MRSFVANVGVGALKNDTPDLSYPHYFEGVFRDASCTNLLASGYRNLFALDFQREFNKVFSVFGTAVVRGKRTHRVMQGEREASV